MRGFGKTDRGLCREINQDSFSFCRISDTLCYAVLCDGMGGENGGNVASELTVRDIGRELSAALGSDAEQKDLRTIMEQAISHAVDHPRARRPVDGVGVPRPGGHVGKAGIGRAGGAVRTAEAHALAQHVRYQRAEKRRVPRMFARVLYAEEALHPLAAYQRQGREVPRPLRAALRPVPPGDENGRALVHAAPQQREAVQAHAGYSLLYAAFARVRPLEGHHQRVAVLHQHQRIDAVGVVICADGLQNAHQRGVQRPRREHPGNAVQRHVLLALRERAQHFPRVYGHFVRA